VSTGLLSREEQPASGSRPAPTRRGGAGLTFQHVRKRFGAVQALADLSFAVEPGRMLGFLGPNGAGKTTAMRAVFGLVELDGGEVLWCGQPIRVQERLRFGYMPEERGLYPRGLVREQLEYFGRLHGMDANAARAAARTWLDRLGLAERGEAKIEELSHGNQQRVQLAAALVHEPELLVLDEPFAGLDAFAVRTLAEVLRGEAARGAAVVFSSHQLELVEEICEDVVIIDHGRDVATGGLEALKRSSTRRRIELELEDASAKWLPAIAGVELLERRMGRLRLLADRDVEPEQVLADARRCAGVVAFSYGPPSLAELFVELIEA